jgi:hypothetical protein
MDLDGQRNAGANAPTPRCERNCSAARLVPVSTKFYGAARRGRNDSVRCVHQNAVSALGARSTGMAKNRAIASQLRRFNSAFSSHAKCCSHMQQPQQMP